jgi:hypothetical protein
MVARETIGPAHLECVRYPDELDDERRRGSRAKQSRTRLATRCRATVSRSPAVGSPSARVVVSGASRRIMWDSRDRCRPPRVSTSPGAIMHRAEATRAPERPVPLAANNAWRYDSVCSGASETGTPNACSSGSRSGSSGRTFSGLAYASSECSMLPWTSAIFGYPRGIGWNGCGGPGRGSTASASTISGGSASAGMRATHMRSRSSTTARSG